jgi:hypothetical protein
MPYRDSDFVLISYSGEFLSKKRNLGKSITKYLVVPSDYVYHNRLEKSRYKMG